MANGNGSLRVLLLTDSDEVGGLLRKLIRGLGHRPVTRSRTTAQDIFELIGSRNWDVMIGHWSQPSTPETEADEIIRRVTGCVRSVEIGNNGGDLTFSALPSGMDDRSEDSEWLVYAAKSALRRFAKKGGPNRVCRRRSPAQNANVLRV